MMPRFSQIQASPGPNFGQSPEFALFGLFRMVAACACQTCLQANHDPPPDPNVHLTVIHSALSQE